MALSREENSLLEAHRREYYPKCVLCGGDRLLLYNLVELAHVVIPPAGGPREYTGKFHLYYPITCQNCGHTVFFHKDVVKKK